MFDKKYRPREIEDMIGSLNVRTSLTTLIKNGKLPNAIILTGDNGIGKTSIAYNLAIKIICGCGKDDCEICKEIKEQLWNYKERSLTNVYEFDLAKDKEDIYVDSIMDVFRISGRKVVILDEIQQLSNTNMSKFLKSFEKLDEETYVIICTTALYKLDSGIISRCEVFEMQAPNTFELAAYLETICRMEGVQFERQAIYAIALTKYRVRDALKSLETIISINNSARMKDVMEYFGKSDKSYPIKFLKACKESSPYALLFLLKDIKEDIGLYKFTVALKETLVDSIYSRYGVKPTFSSDEDNKELKVLTSLFTAEELSYLLKQVDRMNSKSNTDREIVLINLGFALSNGNLMNKSGINEEKKFLKKSSETNMLSEDVDLKETLEVPKGFTIETKSELSDGKKSKNLNQQVIVEDLESLKFLDGLFDA
jgi:DNA polymerase-3 subunit gamma/tau